MKARNKHKCNKYLYVHESLAQNKNRIYTTTWILHENPISCEFSRWLNPRVRTYNFFLFTENTRKFLKFGYEKIELKRA